MKIKPRLLALLGLVLGFGSTHGEVEDAGDARGGPSRKQGGCDNIQDNEDRPRRLYTTNEVAANGTAATAASHELPCSLFMAPSGVEGAGFGMYYTACAPRNGDVVRRGCVRYSTLSNCPD
jgi:hypothetical protein